MVKVRVDHAMQNAEAFDADAWVRNFFDRRSAAALPRLRAAIDFVSGLTPPDQPTIHSWGETVLPLQAGLELVAILDALDVEEDALVAGLLYRPVMDGWLDEQTLLDRFGDEVHALHRSVELMETISALKLTDSGRVLAGNKEQVENVRSMLVAMTDDVRVVLVKLAERICALRAVRFMQPDRGNRVARECLHIYAPLAHRLGIGQLRWEIEDLAFRHLNGAEYRRIARLISERRLDREHYVQDVVSQLTDALALEGISGSVAGRVKHIYSIWRKMQRKGVGFEEIYDVRAVRITVETEQQCYGALGLVHRLWRHIPHELDDYIANPKENGYRSIHTAVVGPSGKVLEVQIRTQAMHRESELGLCAHWAYKEGEDAPTVVDRKIDWLRQVLEWHENLGDVGALSEELRHGHSQERIYVSTPEGDVLDLSSGSTPVDVAYRIHTELGHRCRSARVDGRVVPLNYRLRSGQQIEIITDETPQPRREWLNPVLGYVTSSRARSKILTWFRQRERQKNVAEGRRLLRRELERFGIPQLDLENVTAELGYADPEQLLAALGAGERGVVDVIDHVRPDADSQLKLLGVGETELTGDTDAWEIAGAGRMSVSLGGCCRPKPGQSIVGYLTASNTVTAHRPDCAQLGRLESRAPQRIMALDWVPRAPKRERRIAIIAYDRPGLMRDISTEILAFEVGLTAINTSTDKQANLATVSLTVEANSLRTLAQLMDRIALIGSIVDVRLAD